MANNKEYNEGYEAAIEAIKQSLQGNQGQGGTSSSQSLDPKMTPPPSQGGGSKKENGKNSNDGDQQNPRDSKSGGNQGVVRPEDCIGPDALDKIPGTPGTMMDSETGEDIAEKEGYTPESGSDDAVEKQWSEIAKNAIDTLKQKGSKCGSLISKLEGLYKVKKDWKKELKKIVGYSISNDNTRRAFTNKNVLLTQDRLARTDKTLYDAIDYMIAFIDSSGSMSDEQLKMCLSTVYAAALAKKPIRIYIVQCDTQIQDIQEFDDLRKFQKYSTKATVKGRGGTELKPCWELLKNDKRFKGKRAELVMVFTDGYLDQYKRDPKTMQNLCWVIIDNGGFNLKYKDANTKVVRINSSDVK